MIQPQTEYERNMKNLNYNKYDPFPSLSAAAKPPNYGQNNINNNNSNRIPINIQKTFTQINKYSAFPSLEPSPSSYSNLKTYQKSANIDPKPFDALFLDKYRKTKLW